MTSNQNTRSTVARCSCLPAGDCPSSTKSTAGTRSSPSRRARASVRPTRAAGAGMADRSARRNRRCLEKASQASKATPRDQPSVAILTLHPKIDAAPRLQGGGGGAKLSCNPFRNDRSRDSTRIHWPSSSMSIFQLCAPVLRSENGASGLMSRRLEATLQSTRPGRARAAGVGTPSRPPPLQRPTMLSRMEHQPRWRRIAKERCPGTPVGTTTTA